MPFRKTAAATFTVVVALATAALAPLGAQAAVSCSFAGATATVSLGAASDAVTLKRNGAAIQANGANCGAATVTNTDLIRVDGTTASSQAARIDLGGGQFEPGLTAEAGGGAVSEIEIEVDLRTGASEEIQVFGGIGADTIGFGTAGGKLNGDADVDVTSSGLDQVELDGLGGGDTLTAGGTVAGTGSALSKPADIDGGDGPDALTGGDANDTIVGGTDVAADTIAAGQGSDTARGGAGDDTVRGEAGFDYVDGDLGDDRLFGGQETDNLNYYGGATADGADVMSGGPGLNDILYLSLRSAHQIVKLDNLANDGTDAAADGIAEEGDNVRADVERVETGSGNDLLDARFALARTIPHTLDANAGLDRLYGGDEPDTLDAGLGDDTLEAGDSDDYLYGGGGIDSMVAGDGRDSLYPDLGNDDVDAGPGNDYVDAGGDTSGADNYVGGTGFDRIYYGSRTSHLDIVANNAADDGYDLDGTPGGEEGDNVRPDFEYIDTGTGDDLINLATGPADQVAADNEIYSRAGADTILSGLGEDYVDGGPDADKITGGDGGDEVLGGAGADRFTMTDGFFDSIDGGAGDGVNDTGTFDAFDQRINFP